MNNETKITNEQMKKLKEFFKEQTMKIEKPRQNEYESAVNQGKEFIIDEVMDILGMN